MKNRYRFLFIHLGIPMFLGVMLTLLLVFFTRFESPAQIHWHLFVAISMAILLIWVSFYSIATSRIKENLFSATSVINVLFAVLVGVALFDVIYVLLKGYEIWRYGSIDYIQVGHLIAASGVGLFATLIVGGIQVAIFLVKYWLEERINREKSEKELNRNRHFLLRQQLDPHFIFNSFSTLDALIYKDQTKASQFLHKLSAFYKMILATYERDLIPINEEVDIVNQYVDLLKLRFHEGLQVQFDTDEELDVQVPPLSIQSLVENAVKHNSINEKQPLTIQIFVDNGRTVEVVNNKQLKSRMETSLGIGLENLKSRFDLHNKKIVVKESPTQFQVIFETVP